MEDVAGLEGQKQELGEAIILPLKFPQLFTGPRMHWRGFLLYGPHGTGKSLLLKAVATEADGVTLISISGADLAAKCNDGERMVKTLFAKARETKPSIILIEEIDALSGYMDHHHHAHRRAKTEFLIQMQSQTSYGTGYDNTGVFVVGTTHSQKPWQLCCAVRKRFEKRIYFQLPDANDRSDMFKLHLGSTQHDLTEKDFNGPSRSDPAVTMDDLLTPCSQCEPGATQMDWTTIPEDKLLVPMITNGDVDKSLRRFTPAFVSQEELEQFAEFTNDHVSWYLRHCSRELT